MFTLAIRAVESLVRSIAWRGRRTQPAAAARSYLRHVTFGCYGTSAKPWGAATPRPTHSATDTPPAPHGGGDARNAPCAVPGGTFAIGNVFSTSSCARVVWQ